MPAEADLHAGAAEPSAEDPASQSRQILRAHVREVGRLAEVVGALAKEFERRPRVDVLVVLQQKVAALDAEWERAEAILSGNS
jgi:hypothetical protein